MESIFILLYTLKMVEIYCIVTGRVQGVAYRSYVQEVATELEIVGYVKNYPDSTVHIVAQGSPELLKTFVEYLFEGSSTSTVEGVAVDWKSIAKTYQEFFLLH